MNTEDLRNNEIIQQWFDTINIKDTTINNYLHGIHVYTEYTKKTPEELINEADKEQDENIKVRNRTVNKYLAGFRNYLQDKELAPLSIKSYMNGVKSFYRTFDIEFKPIQQKGLATLQENNKIPSIEDVRDILKTCDSLERAIVLTQCSSGMDSATIGNLIVKDFNYDKETGIGTFQIRREKTTHDYVTFTTPEASWAIIDYLNFRGRVEETGTKRHNQLLKQKVTDESNYLFCLRRVSDDYLKDFDEERRKIQRPAFMKLYRDISTKAQKNTKLGQFNYIRSHNLRKVFNSRMLNSGCDYFHIEEYMGHALPGTQKHYYTPDVEELKKYYSKFIPWLTINKALNIIESPEYIAIKNENDILRAETARHVVDRKEFEELRSIIATLKASPIPDPDPNATEEEQKMYNKMLEKEKEIAVAREGLRSLFRLNE